MGLLIQKSFTTPEGIDISEVYSRIISFHYDLITKTANIRHECYISREKRLESFKPIYVPYMSETYVFQFDTIPTLEEMYSALRTTCIDLGLTPVDVFEPGQPTQSTFISVNTDIPT